MYHHTIWSWAWWVHMQGWDYGGKYGQIVPYDPWSGSVSDYGLLAAAGAMFTHSVLFWKKNTCDGRWWCWRRPHFQLGDTPHMLCARHHPDHHYVPPREAIRQHRERHHKRAPVS